MPNITPSQVLLQGISTLSFFFLENLDSPIYFKIVLRTASLLSFLCLQAEHILRKTSHIVNGGRISRGKTDASNSATLSQRKVTVLPCDGKVREKMAQMHTSEEEEDDKPATLPNCDDIP